MSDFAPGVAAAQAAGVKVSQAPYPTGPEGARVSLETIAKRIREGQSDPRIVELAGKILIEAGFNGRGMGAGSNSERVGALLGWVRGWLLYVPDAPGTERIASAAALACVSKDLCIRIGDCDDQLVLLGSLVGAIGIHVRIVKQNFGPDVQEHVLLEASDESGAWFYADPSTNQPIGGAPRALSEVRVDPMDPNVSDVGAGAVIVTMGRPHGGGFHSRPLRHHFHEGRWWAHWPEHGWLVVEGETCGKWSDPIAASADVYAEGLRQLQASNGTPVSEEYGGRLYLFTVENDHVAVRTCVSAVGVGAPVSVGVGFCDYDLIKSVRARLVAPWYALNGDVDACKAFPIDQKYAFKGDFESFKNWYSGALPDDWFCSNAERDEIEQGRDFEARLNNWRRILAATNCALSAPDLPPLTQDDPRSRDYKPPEGNNTLDQVKSLLITVGIVGGVAAGVYLAFPVLRAGAEAGAAALKGRRRSKVK
jgi:hypothetical protein